MDGHSWTPQRTILRLKILAFHNLPLCHELNHLYKDLYTFIKLPIFVDVLKVVELEVSFQGFRSVIEDLASSVKLVQKPLAFVCYFAIVIVESAKAIHLVVSPVAFVISALLIIKAPVAISLLTFAPLPHEPFVQSTVLVFLLKILEAFFFFVQSRFERLL